jgi:hypothetical protein
VRAGRAVEAWRERPGGHAVSPKLPRTYEAAPTLLVLFAAARARRWRCSAFARRRGFEGALARNRRSMLPCWRHPENRAVEEWPTILERRHLEHRVTL